MILYNDEIHGPHQTLSGRHESRRMISAGNVACMVYNRNAQRFQVQEPEDKRQLGRPGDR